MFWLQIKSGIENLECSKQIRTVLELLFNYFTVMLFACGTNWSPTEIIPAYIV